MRAGLAPVVIEPNLLGSRLDPGDPSSLPSADLGLRVILICQEGYMSSLAADVLLRVGIHRPINVIGGFAAWRSAGLPRRDQVFESCDGAPSVQVAQRLRARRMGGPFPM